MVKKCKSSSFESGFFGISVKAFFIILLESKSQNEDSKTVVCACVQIFAYHSGSDKNA
jgi:hypothetical protein